MAKHTIHHHIKKNPLPVFLLVILLLIGTVLAVFLNGRQADKRTRASDASVSMILTPSTQTLTPNQQFSITVQVDAGTYSLSGYDLTFGTSASAANFVSFTPSGEFGNSLINSVNATENTIHIAGVEPSSKQITGVVTIGVITLQAKSSGSSTIQLVKNQIAASGYDTAIPVNCTPASYSIVTNNPEPTATLTPVPNENDTPEPTNTPTIKTPTATPTSQPTTNTTSNNGNTVDIKKYDFNGDGKIDLSDLLVLISNFHKGGEGDLNSDGRVDITDFSILLRNWRP